MADSENGNVSVMKPNSSSNEDLSEYTDADESISSAPTEFLAEFLSAVMLKDYKTALKYCHLILQYEPHNNTAKEFYPLIVEKLRIEALDRRAKTKAVHTSSGSSSPESYFQVKDDRALSDGGVDESDASSAGDSEDSSSDDGSEDDDDDDVASPGGGSSVSGDRHSDGTTASYSSLEDDEPDTNLSLEALSLKYSVDNVDLGNGNAKIGSTSPSLHSKKAWGVKSTASDQSHKSYASVKSQNSVRSQNSVKSRNSIRSNNSIKSQSNVKSNKSIRSQKSCKSSKHTSSDSESPTEPVSQQLIAELRARVTHP